MKRKKIKGLLAAAMMLCMMVTLFTVCAYADTTISCTVNQNIGTVTVYNGSSSIQSCSYVGTLPDGVQLSYMDSTVYVTGTPTSTGSFSAQVNMTTGNGAESFNVTITVTAATATPTPAPINPVATAAPANTAPTITKNPTGETVEVGGTAQFVARADNADSFVWRIVSADTTNTIPAKDASYYFSGLEVSGADTERLTLSNIPKSLNGWAIECMFKNSAGSSFTTGAIVTVSGATGTTNNPKDTTTTNNSANSDTLKAPKINTQPKGAQLSTGEKHTLSVTASNSTPGIGQLTYQWYSADSNDMSQIKAIDGANSSTYTVPETSGTKYYCVGVWISKDGQKSETTYSSLVEVSYGNGTENGSSGLSPLGTSDPEATASASPTPTATVAPTPENGGDNYDRDGTSSLVFYIVVAALALVAVGGILVYLAIVNSRKGGGDDE